MLSRNNTILSWILQLVVAAILAQTLFFKFSAAEESVYIFSRLGAEPAGRLGTAIAELLAVILILTPRTVVLGAVLSVGLITGAILSHLAVLGIVVRDDGGLLFSLAAAVFLAGSGVLFIRRSQIPIVGRRFAGQPCACCGSPRPATP